MIDLVRPPSQTVEKMTLHRYDPKLSDGVGAAAAAHAKRLIVQTKQKG